MKLLQELTRDEYRTLLILTGIITTVLVWLFSFGISGNDFWWHVKAGELMVENLSLPSVDTFSWYMQEQGIVWISHEWLSQVVLYMIHQITGDLGMLITSLATAIAMMLLIVFRNRQAIASNIWISTIFLIPMAILAKGMFYGRPHLISFFLLFATLSCLYGFRRNENSRSIFLVPFISILWSNFHGGSSTLPYILCFIFALSGFFDFNFGKLHGEKLSSRQLTIYIAIGFSAIAAIAVNPYGLHMLSYPYVNMADMFQQTTINEWMPPDAKNWVHLLIYYTPLLVASLSLVITEKKVKFVDLLVFLFFANMFFRSVRFAIVFDIAATFFIFNYFPGKEMRLSQTKADKIIFYAFLLIFLVISVSSISDILALSRDGKLISVALETKFIDFIKNDSPKRLYNDYDFGVTLIYNEIQTFVDARADLFSPHNLKDASSLETLRQANANAKSKTLDPKVLIEQYNFDAFLTSSRSPLSVYLRSQPESYRILLEDENAVYFRPKNVLPVTE